MKDALGQDLKKGDSATVAVIVVSATEIIMSGKAWLNVRLPSGHYTLVNPSDITKVSPTTREDFTTKPEFMPCGSYS